ncbi:MAG: BlaI/MecI/CopY family transcriptional regulator [Gemmatimonadaceae bacterium]|jgi:predicted transcriptional regulator|nr:BlaI/MecI/CopY family transcriptional regulator [Gemmatimonadaceae bacterium]
MSPARRPDPRRSDPARSPRLQDTIRLSADGLAKVLGDLEARVLKAVWRLGEPVPARAVHEVVVREHAVAPLTVTTVLNKLVDKQVLERRKVRDLLHYRARMTEDAFMAHVSRRVAEGILAFEPARVAASVIDVMAERDPAQLDELERLIQAARRQRDGGAETP